MNHTEIKVLVSVSIFIGAAVWLGAFYIVNFEVISLESLKYSNLSVTVTGLFWLVYFKKAWKWAVIRRLLYRPNLNGTWLGKFESNWINEQNQTNPPKRFVLVIRQRWFTISVRAFTSIQKTESYVETLMLDDDKGKKILAYLFSEKRSGSGEHGARQGAAELDLAEMEMKKLLEGHFWTQAGTKGYIKVRQVSNSEHIDSFALAESKWPSNDCWE